MNLSRKVFTAVMLGFAFIFVILQLSEPAYHMPHIPPHISQLLWTIFIISGVVLLIFYFQSKPAQSPDSLVFKDVLKGKIIDYYTNRIGDIDKLLIDTKQQKYYVHFPPHTAKYVMKAVPKNEIAELVINPSHHKTFDNLPMFEMISARTAAAFFLTDSVPAPVRCRKKNRADRQSRTL